MFRNIFVLSVAALAVCGAAFAENIDPYGDGAQYGWSENTGWLNFKPSQGPGVQVYSDHLEGYVWGENIGWINLSPPNYGGVNNDGSGNLSGYGWGENVGWINFDPQYPGEPRFNPCRVRIDADGFFDGWAWGENIGWIKFDATQGYSVRVCVVGLDDFYNFAGYWLSTKPAADLDESGVVDYSDFGILADFWYDYCPDNWQLK